MKFYRSWSFWSTLTMLIISLVFVVLALDFTPQARMMPLGIGIASCIMIAIVMLSERYRKIGTFFRVDVLNVSQVVTSSGAPPERVMATQRSLPLILAVIFGFLGLVFLFGFVYAVPVFTFLFLKLIARVGWVKAIVISIVMGALVYGLFEIALHGRLFKGILFGARLPPL